MLGRGPAVLHGMHEGLEGREPWNAVRGRVLWLDAVGDRECEIGRYFEVLRKGAFILELSAVDAASDALSRL